MFAARTADPLITSPVLQPLSISGNCSTTYWHYINIQDKEWTIYTFFLDGAGESPLEFCNTNILAWNMYMAKTSLPHKSSKTFLQKQKLVNECKKSF